jgi:16S rRNA (cytosine967-C5)-methyltransferase
MTHGVNRARDLILDLWTKTRIDWGFATDRLSAAFRSDRSLGSGERREVAETLYGMIRQLRRIDFALEGMHVAGATRELARYLAYRVLAGEIAPAAAAAELAGDWEAVARVDERIARERDPVRRLGLARSLPDWLARRLLADHGADADALAAALNARAPMTVRANTLKTTRDALAARLAAEGIVTHPGRWAPAALVLDTRTNAFGLGAFRDGLFEVQDEASQLVAELVAPPPRGLVVDACAGAGGKTLALGALLGNRGRLWALDVDARKLGELVRRARRAGLSNHRAVAVAADAYPDEVEALHGRADRVLVDAPCSGIGALRRNPEARWRLADDDIPRLAAEQLAVARRAMGLVAVGGRLIYATCTVLAEENQAVVDRLLRPGWEVMRVAEIWGSERAAPVTDGAFLTMLPHRHDTDGFFAAVLYRRS